jgi:hypothetical protein
MATREHASCKVIEWRRLRFAVMRSEKLVAEVGESSGTQRKGEISLWKPLPSTGE